MADIDDVFKEIESTKTQLAKEDKEKQALAKLEARRRLQNNAFIKGFRGGTSDDLAPMTKEEQDLLAGNDLEHLVVYNGIVYRTDDDGNVLGDHPELKKKEENHTTEPEKTPHKVLDNAFEHKNTITDPLDDLDIPDMDTEEETPPSVEPEEEPQEDDVQDDVTSIVDTSAIVLEPVITEPEKTPIYIAVAYNEALQKSAYVAIIQKKNNTDILTGMSMTSIGISKAMFYGAMDGLMYFEDLDMSDAVLYVEHETARALRNNSLRIVDTDQKSAKKYMDYITKVSKEKMITVSEVNRGDNQTFDKAQSLAEAICSGFDQ